MTERYIHNVATPHPEHENTITRHYMGSNSSAACYNPHPGRLLVITCPNYDVTTRCGRIRGDLDVLLTGVI